MSCGIHIVEPDTPVVAASDRGLAYGDGLFETMRAHRGRVHWWPLHHARLAAGARRLGIPLPPADAIEAAVASCADAADAVVKLLLTRGTGGRGYAPPAEASPMLLLSRHPVPAVATRPLRLRWCGTRLAIQPALAGLKHCNRLEQVLARGEWDPHDDADEGLMLDTDGLVVCAVAANVLVLRDGRWRTPPVDRCGVRGVCREWALGTLDVEVGPMVPAEVETAEAVVLCNAVRGILPVGRLGDRDWSLHPRVAEVLAALAAANPAFATAMEIP